VPNTALYSSSKHALRGFFNALRAELTQYKKSKIGITICTIGATDTEGTKDIQQKIDGVSWEDPRVVAYEIVASGAARTRELFYPYFLTYPTVVFHFFAPELMEKILQKTMH
jgi:short-subunit dehydrogenase